MRSFEPWRGPLASDIFLVTLACHVDSRDTTYGEPTLSGTVWNVTFESNLGIHMQVIVY